LGEGWYLPSTQELYKIYYTQTFTNPKLTTPLADGVYWSSTEQRGVSTFGFPTAHNLLMNSGAVVASEKSSEHGGARARAIAVF
jgi:hypothetical protein